MATCYHCEGPVVGWCPVRPMNPCETWGEFRERMARQRAQREARAQHHYIDATARALLVAEYVNNGNVKAAARVIRETAEHAHGNALLGHGPLGQ